MNNSEVSNSSSDNFQFQHDRDNITAANNHLKPEDNTETPTQGFQFQHDRDGITAANNHLKPEEATETPTQGFQFQHDRDGITATNNHIKTGDDTNTESQSDTPNYEDFSSREEDTQTSTPLRTAVDIAMAGESPVNRDFPQSKEEDTIPSTPLRTAVDIAMAGESPVNRDFPQSKEEERGLPYQEELSQSVVAVTEEETTPEGQVPQQPQEGEVNAEDDLSQPVEPVEEINAGDDLSQPVEPVEEVTEEETTPEEEVSTQPQEEEVDTEEELSQPVEEVTEEETIPEEESTTTEEERYVEFLRIINELTAQLARIGQLYPNNTELQQNIAGILANIQNMATTIQRLQQAIGVAAQGTQPQAGGTPTQGTQAPAQGTQPQTGAAPTQGTQPQAGATPTQGTQAPTQGTQAPAQGTQAQTTGTATQGTPGAQQQVAGVTIQQGANPIPLEQQSGEIGRRIEQLNTLYQNGTITDAQKIELIDLIKQKEEIDRQINVAETDAQTRRNTKEKWIRIGGIAAGIATGLATGPIGLAGLMVVTLGGTLAGKGLKKWEGKLRSESNSMKYIDRNGMTQDQLEEHDRKQQRKAWWANRLGEASAFVTGGAIGFGAGKFLQNFGSYISDISQTSKAGSSISGTTGEASVAQGGGTPSQVYEGSIEVPPQPIPQGSIGGTISQGGGGQGWLSNTEWLNSSQLGWNSSELGWTGSNVALGPQGGHYGTLNKEFFSELSKLVSKEQIFGQTNALKINPFLQATYRGANPIEAAQNAAQAILGN